MQKKFKKVPIFNNEAEEREFWSRHGSSSYIDWTKAKQVKFPRLKPTTKSISLRLPVSLLERIKVSANQKDVPYQSYLKMLLHEGIRREKKVLQLRSS